MMVRNGYMNLNPFLSAQKNILLGEVPTPILPKFMEVEGEPLKLEEG